MRLEAAAAGLSKVTLRRAFNSFFANTTAQGNEATVAHRAAAAFLNATLSRALNTWRETTTLVAGAMAVIRRVACREVLTMLLAWHETAMEESARMGGLLRAVQFMRHAEIGRAWTSMVEYASSAGAAMDSLRTAMRRLQLMESGKAFRSWHSFASEHAAAMSALNTATRRLQSLELSKAFRGWCEGVEGAHKEATIARTMRALGADRLIRSWRAYRLALMARRREVAAFREWAKNLDAGARRAEAARELAQQAVCRLKEMDKAKGFDTWSAYADERANFMAAGVAVMRAFRHARVGAGLRKWAEYGWQRRTAIALISRVVNGRLYAGFTTWAEVATEQVAALDSAERVMCRLMAQHLAKGFNTWNEYASGQMTQLDAMRAVIMRLTQQALSKSWAQWRAVCERAHATLIAVKNCVRRHTARSEALALRAWWRGSWTVKWTRQALRRWQFVLQSGEFERAAQLMLMESVARKLMLLQTSRYFTHMARMLATERALGAAVARLIQREVARCLESWVQRVHGEQDEADAFELAARRIRNIAANKAFGTWLTFAQARIDALGQLEASLIGMRRAQFGFAYERWHEAVLYYASVRKATTRLLGSQLARAFASWVETADERAEAARQRGLVVAALINQKAGAAFRSWCDAIEEAAAQKGAIRSAVGAFTRQKEAAAWRTWVSHLVDVGAMRHAVGNLANWQLGKAFRGWSEVTTEMERAHRAAVVFRSQGLIAAWNSWNEYLDERDTQQRCLLMLINLGLSRGLRGWADAVAAQRDWAAKLEPAVHAILKAALRRSFNSFLAYSAAVRNAYRQLYAIADFRVSMALRSWVSAVDARSRARAVMSRLLHQTSSKVFRTWLAYLDECADALDALEAAVGKLRNRQSAKAFQSWYGVWSTLRGRMAAKAASKAADDAAKAANAAAAALEALVARADAAPEEGKAALADEVRALAGVATAAVHAAEAAAAEAAAAGADDAAARAQAAARAAAELVERAMHVVSHAAMRLAAAHHADEARRLATEAVVEAAQRAMMESSPPPTAPNQTTALVLSPLSGLIPHTGASDLVRYARGQGRDPASVVVVANRPRTSFEKVGERRPTFADTLFTSTAHFSSSSVKGAVSFGPPKAKPSLSYRRRAWEAAAREERACAALDAGRLPGDGAERRTGGWRVRQRAEERVRWHGYEMATAVSDAMMDDDEYEAVPYEAAPSTVVKRSISFDSRPSRRRK